MKAAAVDIRQYFQHVLGTRPWRVKPGVGSFLTLEFGPKIRAHHHFHGKWHLWIYLSNWWLFHRDRQLVDSDADRKRVTIAIRRLEEETLSNVDFEPGTQKTTFCFNDFRLVVSPADYLGDTDKRDHYWLLFMPNNEVLTVGPSGIQVEHAETPRVQEPMPVVVTGRKFRD
jgi:hypothetical protein